MKVQVSHKTLPDAKNQDAKLAFAAKKKPAAKLSPELSDDHHAELSDDLIALLIAFLGPSSASEKCHSRESLKTLAANIRAMMQKENLHRLTKLAYPASETAALLSMSRRSLQRLVKRDLIRPSRGLRTPRFSREAIINYLHETSA